MSVVFVFILRKEKDCIPIKAGPVSKLCDSYKAECPVHFLEYSNNKKEGSGD